MNCEWTPSPERIKWHWAGHRRISSETEMSKVLGTAVLLAILGAGAWAQEGGHALHGGSGTAGMSAAEMAYREANDRMHAGMAIEFSWDADVDFVRGMIAHHQGAVDMAKIVIEHGKDPDVRKLAEEIVGAQEKEISWMQDWLAKHGG